MFCTGSQQRRRPLNEDSTVPTPVGTIVDYEYENDFNPRSNFGLQSKGAKLIDNYEYEYGYEDYYDDYDDLGPGSDSDSQFKRVRLYKFQKHVWLSGIIIQEGGFYLVN